MDNDSELLKYVKLNFIDLKIKDLKYDEIYTDFKKILSKFDKIKIKENKTP